MNQIRDSEFKQDVNAKVTEAIEHLKKEHQLELEENYLCVRQFRQGIKEVTTEFPAGGIERTDGKEYGSKDAAEAALDCAKRELREETGYESSDWTHLITVPSNATISDNYPSAQKD